MKWTTTVTFRSGLVETETYEDGATAAEDVERLAFHAEVYDHTESITLTPVSDRDLGPSTT